MLLIRRINVTGAPPPNGRRPIFFMPKTLNFLIFIRSQFIVSIILIEICQKHAKNDPVDKVHAPRSNPGPATVNGNAKECVCFLRYTVHKAKIRPYIYIRSARD